jgi:hypothetical protein
MKTQAGYQIQPYEVSGYEVRIHWNIEQKTRQDMQGEVVYWEAEEVLCYVSDSRSVIIEKIIGSVYTTGAEIAIINNQASDPVAYADYQAFRAQAKQLADGWINQRN